VIEQPTGTQEEEHGGQGSIDEHGVAPVEGPQPLPNPPGPVVPTIVRVAGGRAAPLNPGPEPRGIEVT
jgi:hypothetical protein